MSSSPPRMATIDTTSSVTEIRNEISISSSTASITKDPAVDVAVDRNFTMVESRATLNPCKLNPFTPNSKKCVLRLMQTGLIRCSVVDDHSSLNATSASLRTLFEYDLRASPSTIQSENCQDFIIGIIASHDGSAVSSSSGLERNNDRNLLVFQLESRSDMVMWKSKLVQVLSSSSPIDSETSDDSGHLCDTEDNVCAMCGKF